MFRSRFNALYTWPSILASLTPDKHVKASRALKRKQLKSTASERVVVDITPVNNVAMDTTAAQQSSSRDNNDAPPTKKSKED